MDGNGRWAVNQSKTRSYGHSEGLKVTDKIISYANQIGIRYLTLYAFSTENWKRPKAEIDFLMSAFKSKLKKYISNGDKRIRFNLIGDRSKLSGEIILLSQILEKKTEKNSDLTLNLAINYGSRTEILEATKSIALQCAEKKLGCDQITEQLFGKYLYTHEQPDVDLLIRTGGEYRLSNFLLWQSTYAELYFSKKLWPDFSERDLDLAITEFNNRKRRFGGI